MADLPAKPSLDHLRRQARDLLRAAQAGDSKAAGRIRAVSDVLTLANAQLAVAREYGFASWTRLRDEVAARTPGLARQAEAFCEASIRDGTGRAARMLAATSEIARYSFATAVILRDAGRVRTELGRDPGLATQADTRTGWAPLHAASASRWHRLDRPGPRACWPWPGCCWTPAPTPTAAPARRAGTAAGPRCAARSLVRPTRPHQAAAGARRRARRPRSVPGGVR